MSRIELQENKNQHSLKSKIARLTWEVVWLFLYRPTPRWCLNWWRRVLLRIFGAKIGDGVRIQGSTKVWQPWRLRIGAHSWIGGDVLLYSVDEISIGANAVVSEGAFICTASHDIASPIFNLTTMPITIGDGAWIGARAIVLKGVVVGDGAVVAAGAIVSKAVKPWTVVGGNPAKILMKRELRSECQK